MTGHPHQRALSTVCAEEVASWLAQGAAVIVPTETVYGLAVKPGSDRNVQRVFRLKGRPQGLNLPIVIGATSQLSLLGVDFNEAAQVLAGRFWPGPLTIVMGFLPGHSRPRWLDGRAEVAVRLPGLPLLRDMAIEAGPFLLTSANAHGEGPKRVASEAVASLRGQVDFVVDGGTLTPTPSTIVNVRLHPPALERIGSIAATEIADAIGEVWVDDVLALDKPKP